MYLLAHVDFCVLFCFIDVNLLTLPPLLIFFPPGVHCVLRHQLDSLEGERANLASQCEELRLSLQQQRENAQKGSTTSDRVTDSSAQTDPEEAGGTNSSSDTSRRLVC